MSYSHESDLTALCTLERTATLKLLQLDMNNAIVSLLWVQFRHLQNTIIRAHLYSAEITTTLIYFAYPNLSTTKLKSVSRTYLLCASHTLFFIMPAGTQGHRSSSPASILSRKVLATRCSAEHKKNSSMNLNLASPIHAKATHPS
jgi:hypothetical protein